MINNNFSCIYSIINIENNKLYVGSAVNFKTRKNLHISRLNRKVHHSPHLQNSWNKYGEDKFQFEIIELVKDKTKLIEKEQFWIDFFKPEYNARPKANSMLGYKFTKQQKENLRNSRTDRSHSEETKRRISESHKGKTCSDAHKLAMSKARKGKLSSFTGKNHTNETKLKISLSKTGINRKHKKSRTIIQYDLNNNFIKEWEYIAEAARTLNIKRSCISNNVVGLSKKTRNYIFKYK